MGDQKVRDVLFQKMAGHVGTDRNRFDRIGTGHGFVQKDEVFAGRLFQDRGQLLDLQTHAGRIHGAVLTGREERKDVRDRRKDHFFCRNEESQLRQRCTLADRLPIRGLAGVVRSGDNDRIATF